MERQTEILEKLIKIMKTYGITEVPERHWMRLMDGSDGKISFEALPSNPSSLHVLVDMIIFFFKENPHEKVVVKTEDIAYFSPKYEGHSHIVNTLLFHKEKLGIISSWVNSQQDPKQPDLHTNTFFVGTFSLLSVEECLEKLCELCKEHGIVEIPSSHPLHGGEEGESFFQPNELLPTLENLVMLVDIMESHFHEFPSQGVRLSISREPTKLLEEDSVDVSMNFFSEGEEQNLFDIGAVRIRDVDGNWEYEVRIFYYPLPESGIHEGMWVELTE